MKETMEALSTADKYIDLFQQNRELISNGDPEFMKELREQAIRSFQQSGFPLRKQELYKYTHLEPVFAGELSFQFSPRNIQFDDSTLFSCDVPMLDARVLTVLNGFYYDPLSSPLNVLDNGIIYGSLKEAIHQSLSL